MKRVLPLLAALAALPALSGCLSHAVRVDPITVAPMQVQMDVNLHVDDQRAGAAHDASADAAEAAPAADAGASE